MYKQIALHEHNQEKSKDCSDEGSELRYRRDVACVLRIIVTLSLKYSTA